MFVFLFFVVVVFGVFLGWGLCVFFFSFFLGGGGGCWGVEDTRGINNTF